MKPERKIEIIKRYYWSCNNKDHRHLKKETAINCIEREPKNKNYMVPEKIYKLVEKLREQKFTFKEIGKRINRSGSSAQQIYNKQMHRKELSESINYIDNLISLSNSKYVGVISFRIRLIANHYNSKNFSDFESITDSQMLNLRHVSIKNVKEIRTAIEEYKKKIKD